MPRITNEKKMEIIKDFLRENSIAYVEDCIQEKSGASIPLYVPVHKIGVRIGDDQRWYMKSKGNFYPIFIRDEDTKEKVLEKIKNTIIKSMTMHHKNHNKKLKANGHT